MTVSISAPERRDGAMYVGIFFERENAIGDVRLAAPVCLLVL